MTINDKIEELRSNLRTLKEEEAQKLLELRALFLELAESICPIPVGTNVEYEPTKYGETNQIGYEVNYFRELEANVEVTWTVNGKKINKTGEFGVKDFGPIGPATHFVNGTSFKRKEMEVKLKELFNLP